MKRGALAAALIAVAAGIVLPQMISGAPPRAAPTASDPAPAPARATGSASTPASSGEPTSSPTGPVSGGTLRVAMSEPASIDPSFATDETGLTVADALFDTLTRHDREQGIVPAAANRWEVAEDGTAITFHLRRQATFHDGSPVTAHDFVRSFQRVVAGTPDQAARNAHLLRTVAGFEQTRARGVPLAGVRAIDDHTLDVRLREPAAEFLAVAAHPALAPVPASADADPGQFSMRPVGNGPFRMADTWDHGSSIELERSDERGTGAPLLDAVTVETYAGPDSDSRAYGDLVAGEVDVAPVPPQTLAAATGQFGRAADGYTAPGVLDGVAGSITFIGFATWRPPLDDPEVRRALSLLVDRAALTGSGPGGAQTEASSLVPPGIPGYDAGACDYCTFDPDGARTLLAGRDVGPLRIVASPERQAEAARIAADISGATGIGVEPVAVPLSELVGALRRGAADLFLFSWQTETPTPDDVLTRLFATAQIGAGNLTRFSSGYTDALLDRARRTAGPDARLDLYRRAHERILDEMAAAPVSHPRLAQATAGHVRGLVVTPTGRLDLTGAWLAAR